MRWSAVAFACALVACAGPSKRAPASAPPVTFHEESPFRLPHTFEPTGYQVSISLEEHRFTGHVEIAGNISEPSTLLWLHDVDLVVARARAVQGATVVEVDASPPRADEVIELKPRSALSPGAWTLVLDYSGPIHDQQVPVARRKRNQNPDRFSTGVFRRVVGSDAYVFTQGEAVYARQIVPCIDEPDRKVPWQLTLETRKDLVVASNTAIVRETSVARDRKRVEFARTLPLPSYLLAFAVGPFDVVDAGTTKNGVPLRVLALRGHAAKVASISKQLPGLFDQLEARIGIPYAYGKLDVVEVPHLGIGAMENAGLITVDGTVLEPWILTHELAHQWFGNLVTPRWWDDIWLSESFARFLEWDREPDRVAARATTIHSLSSIDVRHPIDSRRDLGAMAFAPEQKIEKGAAVLRLLEAELGPDAFWGAVRQYLTANAHGNVTTSYLVSALANVAGVQRGPAISALLEGSPESLAFKLTCDGTPRVAALFSHRPLPVCVAYDRDGKRAEACATIDRQPHLLDLPAKSCPRWVMPNAGGLGLYETHWERDLVQPLIDVGWASLTRDEQRMLFWELGDEDLKLAAYLKLVAGNPQRVAGESDYLESIRRFVPDDLRAPFDAWFAARSTPAKPAAPAKPVDQLFADLLLTGSSMWQRRAAINALAAMPNILDLLKQDPKRIDRIASWDLTDILFGVCDARSRAQVASLMSTQTMQKTTFVLASIDRCIAKRAKLEPQFRAWLAKP